MMFYYKKLWQSGGKSVHDMTGIPIFRNIFKGLFKHTQVHA